MVFFSTTSLSKWVLECVTCLRCNSAILGWLRHVSGFQKCVNGEFVYHQCPDCCLSGYAS